MLGERQAGKHQGLVNNIRSTEERRRKAWSLVGIISGLVSLSLALSLSLSLSSFTWALSPSAVIHKLP